MIAPAGTSPNVAAEMELADGEPALHVSRKHAMIAEYCNFPGEEFRRHMSARDYARAHGVLNKAAALKSVDLKSHARWRAHVYQFEGRISDAIELLSPLIAGDDLSAKFLRHQRACIYAYAGMHDEALADFRALAADSSPRVVEALRIGCLFEIAHILARQGSSEFCAVYDLVPDGRVQFVVDSMLSKEDLLNLHRANSA